MPSCKNNPIKPETLGIKRLEKFPSLTLCVFAVKPVINMHRYYANEGERSVDLLSVRGTRSICLNYEMCQS